MEVVEKACSQLETSDNCWSTTLVGLRPWLASAPGFFLMLSKSIWPSQQRMAFSFFASSRLALYLICN